MQIFAKVPETVASAGAGGPACLAEWALVELQGDLESRSELSLAGQLIGDVHFTRQGVPVLIVGHHILWGKVATLEKPLLVMSKRQRTAEASAGDGEVMEMETGAETDNSRYHIQAVIRRKILFKSRPKPIIANVPKKV